VEVDAVDRVHLADLALEEARTDRKVFDEAFDAQDLRALGRARKRCGFGGGAGQDVASTVSWSFEPRPISSSAK
jgi:hypothetical protein